MKRTLITILSLILAISLSAVLGIFAFAEGETIRFEGESTPFTAIDSNGDEILTSNEKNTWAWNLKFNKSSIAGSISGDIAYFRTGGVGGTINYEIELDKAGEYSLTWAHRPHDDSYCSVQIMVNGEDVGSVISAKNGDEVNGKPNQASVMRTVIVGNASFNEGKNTVTFKLVKLKDNGDANRSAFTVDYFELGDPVDDLDINPVKLEIATKENSTPTSVEIPEGMLDTYDNKAETPKTTDKITVHPLAECYNPSSILKLTVDGVEVPVTTLDGDYEYAAFDYDPSKGEVKIEAELISGNVTKGSVSPDKLGVKAEKSGKKLIATIKENYTYTFYVNDYKLNIAANPMETNVPAKTGTGIFNITEAPYSVTKDMTDAQMTAAFQKALDDASAYGSIKGNKNGVVYIPAGVYYVGDLEISSNTYVYLEASAAVRISSDKSLLKVAACKTSMKKPDGSKGLDFTWWINTAFEEVTVKDEKTGQDVKKALGSYDIRIGGRGTFDCRDDAFWKETSMGCNSIVPIACSQFTLEGVTIREAVCWSVVAVRSDNLTFEWLKLYQRMDRDFEDDCIDICESQKVNVKNCIGFARDDPFSTKTWPYKTGITMNWPGYPEYLDDVTFEECTSYTGCFSFKVGQGTDQNQYNVTFRECTALRSTMAFGVHAKSGAGTVSDVLFENCYVEDMFGSYDGHSAWFIVYTQHNGRGDGNVRNVTVKNMHIREGEVHGTDTRIKEFLLKIWGYSKDSTVEGVTFTDIYVGDKLIESLDEMQPKMDINEFASDVKLINTGDEVNEGDKPGDNENTGNENNGNENTGNENNGNENNGNENTGENEDSPSALPIVLGVGGVILVGAVAAVFIIKKKK